MERVRGAGGRAVKTTVEQTLMRGLVTAVPCVRPGLPPTDPAGTPEESFPLSSQPRVGTAALLALVRWIEAYREPGHVARADHMAGVADGSPAQADGASRPARH